MHITYQRLSKFHNKKKRRIQGVRGEGGSQSPSHSDPGKQKIYSNYNHYFNHSH